MTTLIHGLFIQHHLRLVSNVESQVSPQSELILYFNEILGDACHINL
jgi:hypothetical protein